MTTRITIFNHKGGVGKTTLTVNIAFALSEMGKSVLLVDSDPQCNLTSHLLSEDVVDNLLEESNTESGQTIWSAVHYAVDGIGIGKPIEGQYVGDLCLLAGDLRLSEFEEYLADAWADCFKRRSSGYRAINALSQLVDQKCKGGQFDFVFYDTGPNIGPLNRVLLLDSDYFIVPVACDLFSIRALSTLGRTLSRWIEDARSIEAIAPDNVDLLAAKPSLLGYIPQRFREYGRKMTKGSEGYLREIDKRMHKELSSVLRDIDESYAEARPRRIGDVKDFHALVQSSQKSGRSMWDVRKGTPKQREEARASFKKIAQFLTQNT